MPQVEVDGLRINYDVQGNGEPLLLIPVIPVSCLRATGTLKYVFSVAPLGIRS